MRIHPLRASNHDLNGYFVIKNNQGGVWEANNFALTMSSPFTCIGIAQNISVWEEAFGPHSL
jgi:hypothetical protein